MKNKLLTVWMVLVLLVSAYLSYKIYYSYQCSRIHVKVGDCLASGKPIQEANYFMQILNIEGGKDQKILFLFLSPKEAFTGKISVYDFNKTAKKEKVYFLDCNTLKFLRDF